MSKLFSAVVIFLGVLVIALFSLPAAVSAAPVLQVTSTPYPSNIKSPTPMGSPVVLPTRTPLPTQNFGCPAGGVTGDGAVTPSADWLATCGHCLSTVTPSVYQPPVEICTTPTGTPEGTVTPSCSVATVTPTPTPTNTVIPGNGVTFNLGSTCLSTSVNEVCTLTEGGKGFTVTDVDASSNLSAQRTVSFQTVNTTGSPVSGYLWLYAFARTNRVEITRLSWTMIPSEYMSFTERDQGDGWFRAVAVPVTFGVGTVSQAVIVNTNPSSSWYFAVEGLDLRVSMVANPDPAVPTPSPTPSPTPDPNAGTYCSQVNNTAESPFITDLGGTIIRHDCIDLSSNAVVAFLDTYYLGFLNPLINVFRGFLMLLPEGGFMVCFVGRSLALRVFGIDLTTQAVMLMSAGMIFSILRFFLPSIARVINAEDHHGGGGGGGGGRPPAHGDEDYRGD